MEKHLTLSPTEKVLKINIEVKYNNLGDPDEKYMKIRINSDNDIPLE